MRPLRLRSYKKLPEHVKVGSQILCADGSFVLEVLETDPKAGTVRAKAMNNASLGCDHNKPLSTLP